MLSLKNVGSSAWPELHESFSHVESWELVFTLVLLLLLPLYYYYYNNTNEITRRPSSSATSASTVSRPRLAACDNPSCVRCQSYDSIFNHNIILQKLDTYSEIYPSRCGPDTNRVLSALRRKYTDSGSTSSATATQNDSTSTEAKTDLLLYLEFLEPRQPVWNSSCLLPSLSRHPDLDEHKRSSMSMSSSVGGGSGLQRGVFQFEQINNELILSECEKLISANGFVYNDTPAGTWLKAAFIDQGQCIYDNCLLAPYCWQVLSSLDSDNTLPNIPNLPKACFMNAFISILLPNSIIEPHVGVTNARIRGHYGVQIPTPHLARSLQSRHVCRPMGVSSVLSRTARFARAHGAMDHERPPVRDDIGDLESLEFDLSLRVADQVMGWHERQWLCFDDSLLHSVNYTCHVNPLSQPSHKSVSTLEASSGPDEHVPAGSLSMMGMDSIMPLDRVVLVVDFYHPDLSPDEIHTLEHVFQL